MVLLLHVSQQIGVVIHKDLHHQGLEVGLAAEAEALAHGSEEHLLLIMVHALLLHQVRGTDVVHRPRSRLRRDLVVRERIMHIVVEACMLVKLSELPKIFFSVVAILVVINRLLHVLVFKVENWRI